MKKAVFLLTLFLAFSIASSGLASSPPQERILLDSYEVKTPLWDIPWLCSPQEFLSSVKDKQGLTFIPTEHFDSYVLSAPADFHFAGEPVKTCKAYFTPLFVSTFIDIDAALYDESVYTVPDPSDLKWWGTVFEYFTLADETTAEDCMAAFVRLYDKLFAQYGPPLDSSLRIKPRPDSRNYEFAFPTANHSVDQPLTLQLLEGSYQKVTLLAQFDNRGLVLISQPAIDPDAFVLRLVARDKQTVFSFQYTPYTSPLQLE